MNTVSKTIHISDTVHGSIPISYLEKRIISTRIFNRLHNISQNSTAYLTYPTNRTKRFEHSIGTMHLCSQMFMYGINNGDEETVDDFFMDLDAEIKSILESKLSDGGDHIYRNKLDDTNLKEDVLYKYKDKIEINDYIYRLNIPKQILDKGKEVPYILVFQSIRLAAMLHDIGHPPMSHITENAIKNVWEEIYINKNRNEKENEFYECIKPFYNKKTEKFELHEKIGFNISRKLLEHNIKEYDSNKDRYYLYKTLFELIVMDMTICILGEKTPFFKWLHKIIAGSLDGDRLDYVTRDPINSGIDAGKIEYDRLLSTMKLIKYKDDSYWFCPHIKMIDIVDDFFYRRWMMYKKIVYHHRVVKTDYLMENCIERISKDFFADDIAEDTSTSQKEILPYDISGIWKGIKGQASYDGYFNKVLQWDDSWLLTILKKHYYNDYKPSYTDEGMKEYKDIFYKLEELISNRKSYYSLLKKDADLLLLDKHIVEKISNRSEEILHSINKLKGLKSPKGSTDKSNKVSLNIDPFLDTIEFFLTYVNNRYTTGINSGSYILSVFRFEVSSIFPNGSTFDRIIKESLNETLLDNKDIGGFFYNIKKVKTGINENLMLYSEGARGSIQVHIYEHISDTNFILERRRNALIPVNIYLRKEDVNINVNFENIIEKLGINIGEKICNEIEQHINNLINNKEVALCAQ